MELYQLRIFLVIARTGNLTRAAAELHASQPTLSGQLKALEDELSLTLFVRTSRGMELSEAGKQLRDKAQEVADRASELTALAASLARDRPIRCRLGVNTTATALRIPQLVAMLAETAPQLHLELHHDQTHSIVEDVARGALDAGFLFGRCEQSGVTCARLAEVELAMIGPVAWQSVLGDAPWEDLLAKPWALPPEKCPFYAKTRELLLPLCQWPRVQVTVDDEATMLDLVSAQAGVALLPAFMVEGETGVSILRRTQTKLDLAFAWQTASREAVQLLPVLRALERIWPQATFGFDA